MPVWQNNFHICIKIPPMEDISEEELLNRFRLHKDNEKMHFVNKAEKLAFKEQIHDISFIIGNYEQRFVTWFNKRHDSWGRLFGQPFDSELIEVSERSSSLMRVMAYITLNPVRAGLVADPKDFHFCGYADRLAAGRFGVDDDQLFDLFCSDVEAVSPKDKRGHFQKMFRAFMLGLKQFKSADSITLKEFFAKCDLKEELHWDDLFMHKCSFFTKCMVIGSEEFIREKIEKFSSAMGWKREHEPYTEDAWDRIYSLKSKRRKRAPANG
jgi:hypothetical protein